MLFLTHGRGEAEEGAEEEAEEGAEEEAEEGRRRGEVKRPNTSVHLYVPFPSLLSNDCTSNHTV